MADKNDDSFLGGGIKFNSAGVGANTDLEPLAETAPQGVQPHQIRAAIIIALIVIMVAALFAISIKDLSGVQHSNKHHATTPDQKPVPNDKSY